MNPRKNPGFFTLVFTMILFLPLFGTQVYASSDSFPLPCAGVERVLSKLSTSYIYETDWKPSDEAGEDNALKETSAEKTQDQESEVNKDEAGEETRAQTAEENTGENETADVTAESAPEEPPAESPAEAAPAVATNNRIICIDAGHQARADTSKEPIGPGATETKPKVAAGTRGTTTGLAEYELTLAVALKLQNILTRRGYTVVMCRTSHDVNISNSERAAIANNAGAGAFIRLHANGSTSSSASGAETLAPSASNPYCASIAAASQSLSRHVLNGMCAKSGAKNRGVQIADNMSGINWSRVPVTIVEMGFMTNPNEDLLMADDAYQTKLAEGMADGIDAYFAG